LALDKNHKSSPSLQLLEKEEEEERRLTDISPAAFLHLILFVPHPNSLSSDGSSLTLYMLLNAGLGVLGNTYSYSGHNFLTNVSNIALYSRTALSAEFLL
jgi:hypothetical protein